MKIMGNTHCSPSKKFQNHKKIMGVNRLIKEVESEYSVFKTYNILAWFENLIKITFFGVYSKMAENSLIRRAK